MLECLGKMRTTEEKLNICQERNSKLAEKEASRGISAAHLREKDAHMLRLNTQMMAEEW